MTKRTLLKASVVQVMALAAGLLRPAQATERVGKLRPHNDYGVLVDPSYTHPSFQSNMTNGGNGTFFTVYTKEEVDGVIARVRGLDTTAAALGGRLGTLETNSATKAELAANQVVLSDALKQVVNNSLGTDQAKAIKAQVRAELKADPEFRQEMKAEVKQELLMDTDFIAQIAAKLPAHP